jgi:sugar phosphate isomerase/epimerase
MSPVDSPDDGIALDLDLGFTLGLDMAFEEAVRWASAEGFAFVELLLDGPYARDRVAGGVEAMRSTLADAGVDVVVHLPFAIDPGSPFASVRQGVVEEFVAGMDLATAFPELLSRYPSAAMTFDTSHALGKRHVEELLGGTRGGAASD